MLLKQHFSEVRMDIRSLSRAELFQGIREEDLAALVDWLNTHEKR